MIYVDKSYKWFGSLDNIIKCKMVIDEGQVLKYVDNAFIGGFYFHDIKYLVKCHIPLNKNITILCFQMKKKLINNLLSFTFIYKYVKNDLG